MIGSYTKILVATIIMHLLRVNPLFILLICSTVILILLQIFASSSGDYQVEQLTESQAIKKHIEKLRKDIDTLNSARASSFDESFRQRSESCKTRFVFIDLGASKGKIYIYDFITYCFKVMLLRLF